MGFTLEVGLQVYRLRNCRLDSDPERTGLNPFQTAVPEGFEKTRSHFTLM